MGLINAISEQRRKQIESHAQPFLSDGEAIEHWVRARHPSRRGEGFLYVTKTRLIVVLGGADHRFVVPWIEIRAWGVDRSARGGPVLGFEGPTEKVYARLPVMTTGAATNVRSFLDLFARRAEKASNGLERDENFLLAPHTEDGIEVHKLSVGALTKRIIKTVLGVVLAVGGLVLTPLPGPWSFPIIIGGLAILSSEYDWAKDSLEWIKTKYKNTKDRFTKRRARGAG